MHIWGLTGDRLVAAGGSPDQGRIHVLEGDVVTEQTIPDVGLMNWSYGFSENDITTVGYQGAILHWDGSTWTQQDSGTTQDLWGIWGAAPDDLWAVGGTARRPMEAVPTLLHYDGSAWTEQELPPITPVNVTAIFKIWGSAANDVYAVGVGGAVIHYDGSAWTEEVVNARGDFSAIWGSGPDNIVAVGGLANGHLSHWNGTEWRSVDLSPLPGLNGVWTQNGNTAHVCGLNGFVGTVDLDTLEVTEEVAETRRQFHATFGVDGSLFAVGGNLASPDQSVGVAFRRDLGDDE